MSRLSDLIVRIRADVGNFQRGMSRIDKNFRHIDRQADRTARSINNSFSRIVSTAVVATVGRKITDLAGRFQEIETQMRFMTGSNAEAAEEMEFLRETSERLSVSFEILAKSNAKLIGIQKSVGISDEQRIGLLVGLSDASKALGVSNANLELAYYSLGQALGSANVQFDEVRDIIEKFPGLLGNIEKANNLTTGSFKKMIAAGQISGKQFADFLIPALKEYEGAAVAGFGNINSAIIRFQNKMLEAGEAFSKPISPILGKSLDGLGAAFVGVSKSISNSIAMFSSWVQLFQDELPELSKFIRNITNHIAQSFANVAKGFEIMSVTADERIAGQIKRVEKARKTFQTMDELLQEGSPFSSGVARTEAFAKFRKENEKLLKMQKERAAEIKSIEEDETKAQQLKNSDPVPEMPKRNKEGINKVIDQAFKAQEEAYKRAVTSSRKMSKVETIPDTIKLPEFDGSWRENIDDFDAGLEGLQDKFKDMDSLAKSFGDTIGDTLDNAIMNGGKLSDVFKGLVADLAQLIVKTTILDPLMSNISSGGGASGSGGGGGGGGFDFGSIISSAVSSIGSFFAGGGGIPGFAKGGRPAVGKPSIVGERGAELFIPDTAGTILSNSKSKEVMGNQPVLNFNYTFGDGVEGATRTEILKALPSIIEASKNSVLEAVQRGGGLSRAVGVQ